MAAACGRSMSCHPSRVRMADGRPGEAITMTKTKTKFAVWWMSGRDWMVAVAVVVAAVGNAPWCIELDCGFGLVVCGGVVEEAGRGCITTGV